MDGQPAEQTNDRTPERTVEEANEWVNRNNEQSDEHTV